LALLDDEGAQAAAAGIQAGGEAGGAGAQNDHVVNFAHWKILLFLRIPAWGGPGRAAPYRLSPQIHGRSRRRRPAKGRPPLTGSGGIRPRRWSGPPPRWSGPPGRAPPACGGGPSPRRGRGRGCPGGGEWRWWARSEEHTSE